MGFFSGICDFVSGTLTSIGSCISNCCSAIGSAIGAVSNTLAEIAKPFLNVVAGLSETVIKAVIGIIHTIAIALGIVKEDVEPEEIGARALGHPETKPENYDSYKEYIDALMEQDFDKKKWEKEASIQEKAAAITLGSSIEAKAIEEKNDMNIPVDIYLAAHNKGYSPEALQKTFDSLKSHGVRDASVITDYFNGELKGEMNDKIEAILGEVKSQETPTQ